MIHFLYEYIKSLKLFFKDRLNKYNITLSYGIAVLIALFMVVAGINLFIELTETLATDMLANYDHRFTQYVISHRSAALTKYFIAITHVGDVYGYIAVLLIVFLVSLLVFKSWKYVVQIIVVLMLSAVSNLMLKRFIDRARPDLEHMVSVETLSYPSGHAMSAMAFYGFLIYLFYKFSIPTLAKYSIITFLFLLILSIGISRIYLGVHFPSDIAGGFIAGAIWVVFCALLFNLIDLFRKELNKQ
ncbi:phosphatase PAP2 family protein [Mariniflexile ostreae]|uniref:Phosphatase PAP2 family protein n=1 Tax=Mariniflexile ostreae TaxID=1520892 RepID=A0ABV5FDP7_9FLAO